MYHDSKMIVYRSGFANFDKTAASRLPLIGIHHFFSDNICCFFFVDICLKFYRLKSQQRECVIDEIKFANSIFAIPGVSAGGNAAPVAGILRRYSSPANGARFFGSSGCARSYRAMFAGSGHRAKRRQSSAVAFCGDQQFGCKREIRIAAEKEEHEFYHGRATEEWLDALTPFGTDEHKPFLETAPYLIAIFAESYEIAPDGEKIKNYYVTESVGIATGFLIAALHNAGLATLTHTPSPMKFLNEILDRPSQERPFLLLVVGYPTDNATVPDIAKKPLQSIASFVG